VVPSVRNNSHPLIPLPTSGAPAVAPGARLRALHPRPRVEAFENYVADHCVAATRSGWRTAPRRSRSPLRAVGWDRATRWSYSLPFVHVLTHHHASHRRGHAGIPATSIRRRTAIRSAEPVCARLTPAAGVRSHIRALFRQHGASPTIESLGVSGSQDGSGRRASGGRDPRPGALG